MAKLYPISTAHNHDEVYAKIGEGGGGVTDHGALSGLADNDHPQYLLTTAKAADSDKVDGKHAADFLGVNAKAADSDKLDGLDSTAFATAGHDHEQYASAEGSDITRSAKHATKATAISLISDTQPASPIPGMVWLDTNG